jgi:hypothetical protein
MNQNRRERLQKEARHGLRELKRMEAHAELMRTIDDWPAWLRLLEMDIGEGMEAFYDSKADSPHEDFRDALEDDDIKGLGVFMPRGVGKTYSVLLPWLLREIVRNPDITILLGSESEAMAIEQRTTWLRAKLMLLEEKGYGPFKTAQWAAGRFTVKRPKGTGGQPTVVAWGPNSSGTGRHWNLGIFDDLYGEMSAENPEVRTKVTRKLIRILGQRMPSTRMIFIGTMWPGRETYYYKMRKDPKVSPHYKIMSYRARDAKGHILFKCLTADFLARQRAEMPPALYRSQYDNAVTDDDELDFEPEDFHTGLPPEGVPLATYMITDTAFTVMSDRRASYSALAIIQKTPMNVAYVVDLAIARWPADLLPAKLLEMYEKWRNLGHPPIWYCMETQGPGGQYPAHIKTLAEKEGIDPPMHHAVSHAKANKIVRIENSRGPIRSGMIIFSPNLDRSMFYKEPGREPTGLLGDDYMRFTHHSRLSFDGPDAIADAQAKDKFGLYLCPPPIEGQAKKASTVYSRSLEKATRGYRRKVLY